jgi:putative ABC transport system permease protein
VITPSGLGVAFATYIGAVCIAVVLVVQRIWRFDLVAVLKTRD